MNSGSVLTSAGYCRNLKNYPYDRPELLVPYFKGASDRLQSDIGHFLGPYTALSSQSRNFRVFSEVKDFGFLARSPVVEFPKNKPPASGVLARGLGYKM